MMFIGIDHGTEAIRFATTTGSTFELKRKKASEMNKKDILSEIQTGLLIDLEEVKLIAITYSMGDGFSKITDIKNVRDRGVRKKEAGICVGGGTNVFDALKNSNLPAIVIPGIHASLDIDPRMKVWSHGASPEKIGAAYHAYLAGAKDFIICDISSNTVTVAVSNGKIVGAIDACIFAPGLSQGPLDLDAIRSVDQKKMSANEAFSRGGVLKMTSFSSVSEMLASNDGKKGKNVALKALALFAAMEIYSMKLLLRDYDSKCEGKVFLAGSLSEIPEVMSEIERLLEGKAESLGKWSAAIGCAEISKDVYSGKDEILGIKVDWKRMS